MVKNHLTNQDADIIGDGHVTVIKCNIIQISVLVKYFILHCMSTSAHGV